MSRGPGPRPERPADSPGPPPLSLSDRLRFASERGDLDSARELLAAGAGFRPDQDGRTALHYSSQHGHVDLCEALIVSGCGVNVQDLMGYTPLIRASSQGFREVVQLLLSSGCDPDLQDEHGNAAIHEACWNGFSKCAELLTGHDCDVSVTNKAGFTALHLAAQNGHNESSRVLLYAGCNTDLKNNYGDTALHTAARYGHAGVARILISAKCRLNEQNKNGDTSLHIAAALKRRKIAKILVESGMDLNLLNKQGETAIDVARRKDHPEIILIISTYTPTSTPSPTKPVHSTRRHGDGFGVTFKDEIELADGPVVCPDEDLPLKHEPAKPEKQERFLFFFKKKKKDKEKDKAAVQAAGASPGQHDHHHNHLHKSNPDLPQQQHHQHHQQQQQHHHPSKSAVHGFFSQYIPRDGVQLYRDLAGNIKQGPIGYAPVCQCGPSLKKLETNLLDTKDALHKCVESSHNTLSHRLDRLNVQNSREHQDIRASLRDRFHQEHNACHARISERLHEERRETHALMGRANADMKEEIESWLHDKLASYGHCLDHHHDDSALPPRNLFLDFPGMGRLVRSRSDETLSVSDYSGKHRKKDFYASRKAAMEQIRAWDVPRMARDDDVDMTDRERNNDNNNNYGVNKHRMGNATMVTKAQVHTSPPHAPIRNNNSNNNRTYGSGSRENIFSPSSGNSYPSPSTYFNGSIHDARRSSHGQSPSSPAQQQHQHEQHQDQRQHQQHTLPNAPPGIGRASRPGGVPPSRASSQPRVSFSPHNPHIGAPTHVPRSSSSPPLPIMASPPVPAPRSSQVNASRRGSATPLTAATPNSQHSSGGRQPQPYDRTSSPAGAARPATATSSSQPNLDAGGPPDAENTRSVERGPPSSQLRLSGRDSNFTPRPTSAESTSNTSGLTGETSSNGSRGGNNNNNNSNNNIATGGASHLTRYQDSYGVRFSRPRTLSSDSLLGENLQPIPRSRSVENTLEDSNVDPGLYNSGYVTDSAVRSLQTTPGNSGHSYNPVPLRATTRYRLPETSAGFHSGGSTRNAPAERVKGPPPPVLPKRNHQNFPSKTNQNNTQQPTATNDIRGDDGGFTFQHLSGDRNISGRRGSDDLYRPNPKDFSQDSLIPSHSMSTPLPDCLQHDSFLSPGTSPSLPFANGNKEDSTCSSNQDSGYDSRANRRTTGDRKGGDTSAGTPSSSFSAERSNCNTPSYSSSPYVVGMKDGQSSSDVKDSVVQRLQYDSYSHSQNQINGLNNRSKDNGRNRSIDAFQDRRSDVQSYPHQAERDNGQRSVFNDNDRNFPVSQSPQYYTNNNRNVYKNPVPSNSHSSYSPMNRADNPISNGQSGHGDFNRQQSLRTSQQEVRGSPVSGENQAGQSYNSRRQPPAYNNHSDGRLYDSSENSSNLPSSGNKDGKFNVPEYRSTGQGNNAAKISSMPSYSTSQTPRPSAPPPYRASPLSASKGPIASPYMNRGSSFQPKQQPNSDSGVRRDSTQGVNAPVKSPGRLDYNSSTTNGDSEATQTKVEAHIEGWYQRKLMEAAQRLRQNHAYGQPTQDSYEDQTFATKGRQPPSSYHQPSSYSPRWSSGKDLPSSHQSPSGNKDLYSRNYPPNESSKDYSYDTTRMERNSSNSYGYHHQPSSYSTDYNYDSERMDGRVRNADESSGGVQSTDRWNKNSQSFPTERQNGSAVRYDPIHGSDV